MTEKLRVVELGWNICPCLEGDDRYYLENYVILTASKSRNEPGSSEENEQLLLDFILTIAASRQKKKSEIDSLITQYFVDDMMRKRRGHIFKLLETIPEHGQPLWKLKIKAFFIERDYRHTWFDRLKSCIAFLAVIHIIACMLLPDIRNWTLDIIVRCNEEYFLEYFNSLIQWHTPSPPQESFESFLKFL